MKLVNLKFKDGTSYKTLAYDEQPLNEIIEKANDIHSKVKDADEIEFVRNIEDKLIKLELFTEREIYIAINLAGESMETLDKLSKIAYGKDKVYDLLSEKEAI